MINNNNPQNICTRLTGGGDNAEAVTICQVSGGFTLCLTSVVNSSRVHWYSRSSNHRRHLPVIRTDSEICPPRHTCAPVCVCVCRIHLQALERWRSDRPCAVRRCCVLQNRSINLGEWIARRTEPPPLLSRGAGLL